LYRSRCSYFLSIPILRCNRQDIHKRQELTPADVERMYTTQRQQDQDIAKFIEQKKELDQRVWKCEMQVDKQIAELDEAVKQYTGMIEALKINTTAHSNMFIIAPNTKGKNADEIVSNSVVSSIRESVVAMCEQVNTNTAQAQQDALAITETLRKLDEIRREKSDEIQIMEASLAALERQYNEEREVSLLIKLR
jgi:SMC interacting uncharacterized protein involved in chromosome segregation